jgi:predicted amidophosphoribosyltransferase
LTCTECWDTEFSFQACCALGLLDGPLSRAVVLLKDGGEQRLATVLGQLLAARIKRMWGDWADAVCWVPASRAAIRRRGFDHAALLADRVAQCLGVPAHPALQRVRSTELRGLGKAERAQVTRGFHAARRVHGNIVLIDDVFTSGATAQAATDALLLAGAAAVRIAVLARTW